MEAEVGNFILTWCTILASLSYSYALGKLTANRITRLLFLLPIILLFFFIPFNISSIYLRANTAFFISWLSTFKLLLFSFRTGPLSSPSLSFPQFLAIASLPIQLRPPKPTSPPPTPFSLPILFLKTILFLLLFTAYRYTNPYLLLLVHSLHLYISLEAAFLALAAMAKLLFHGAQLEPQFDEPYLSTSLQDFWGRRWNLVVSNILRPTVYVPVRRMWSGVVGRKWAQIPAVVFTFAVSGIMHELMYFYICDDGLRPTWEVTAFFILHGISMAIEVVVGKMALCRIGIPRVLSTFLTLSFLGVTAFWLFFPQLHRCDAVGRTVEEVIGFGDFVRNSSLWSLLT